MLGQRAHSASLTQGSHAPALPQTGSGLAHCSLVMQSVQMCVARLQTCVAQFASETHCTQRPFIPSFESVTQTLPSGLQSASPLADVQARQSRLAASQIGVAPEHSASLKQPMQVSVAASQSGVAPVQADLLAAVHWTHCP